MHTTTAIATAAATTVWFCRSLHLSEQFSFTVYAGGASYFDMRNCHMLSSSLWKLLGRQIMPTF